MLYAPPPYGGATAQTGSCHLMQTDAFGDSLAATVNNPTEEAATYGVHPCITGNKKYNLNMNKKQTLLPMNLA